MILITVHCPDGENRSQSFDYYAHPTSRGSLFQFKGLGVSSDSKLRLRKTVSHNVTTNRSVVSGNIGNNNNHASKDNDLRDAKEEAQVFMDPRQEGIEDSSGIHDKMTGKVRSSCQKVRKSILLDIPANKSCCYSIMALLKFWRTFIVVGVPLICSPILWQGEPGKTEQAFKCAYVMLIMATFWVTEALPLAVTSLIPVALLPILGNWRKIEIVTTCIIHLHHFQAWWLLMLLARNILKRPTLCLWVESSLPLPLNIATFTNASPWMSCWQLVQVQEGMLTFGIWDTKDHNVDPHRLMLGFMLPTMFLSMWISNTATTAMMVPIVDAVITELEKDMEGKDLPQKYESFNYE